MSRDDIADSLPGVAISISLVPPLCVVGIALSAGQWTAAGGAMLLFLTNLFSILLAGGGRPGLAWPGRRGDAEFTGTPLAVDAFLIIGLGLVIDHHIFSFDKHQANQGNSNRVPGQSKC